MLFISCFLLGIAGLHAQTPVASYPFSGDLTDASAFGNDASANAVSLTQDRFGVANEAVLLDGTQSTLTAPVADHLNADFTTVAFWVRVDALPGQAEAYLIALGGWQERFKISVPPHGKPVFTTNATSGISDMDAGDGNELAPGVWTHLTFVHDGTNDIIYMNGVEVASKAVAGALNSSTTPLGMGYDPVGGSLFFEGALDDVLIFDEALDATTIADLYAAQTTEPMFPQGEVASYDLDGNGLDGSGYGNHATTQDLSVVTNRHGFGQSAMAFNGTTSQATAPASAQLNSDFATVAFWIKLNSLPEQGEYYLMSNGGWQERWKISLPGHGKPVWTTNATSGISDMDSGDGNVLVPGEWAHLAFVHDGTNDLIYLNGAQVAAKAVGGALNSTTYPLGMGYNPIDGGSYMDGALDDVAIFNVALDSMTIADLYAAQSMSPATDEELIASYPFTGNAEDASQFGNHAQVGGATLAADRFGYGGNAYSFAGNDSLVAPNSSVLNTDFTTIAFWVKVDSLPAQGEVYLMSNGGWQERWKISLPGHGKPVFTTNATSGISDMDSGDGNELVEGEWAHLAFVHDGTNDIIYLNGVEAASKAVAGALNDTGYPLGIGNNPIDGGSYFVGSIDEVLVFNRALTAQEIADAYAAQSAAPAFDEELVANYTFSGNAEDETVFSNHASVVGALPADDRFGQANQTYQLDGVDDALTAANSPQQNSDFTTVSFWVNLNELPGNGEYYLLSNGGWQERWKISLPPHGKPVWTTNATSGISDMDSGDGNELVPGTWTHVAMSHDGTTDKIYLDGNLVASKEVAGALNSTVHPLGIGYNPIDGANFTNGSLDEVRIYNRALTDQEVADLYAAQSAEPEPTDTIAPSAPLGLIAEVTFNNVDLSWQAASDEVGVTGYNVFQDSVKVATTTATTLYLPELTPLTTFEFGVSAVDAAGNESTQTTLLVTTGEESSPDTIPPTAPGNLRGDAGSNSVALAWDASTDDRQVAGYVVLVDGFEFDTLAPSRTSVIIPDLEAETAYFFEVYAFDAADNASDVSDLLLSTEAEIDAGEPGLVAWYPFEGNANDATPYENHGAIGGDPIFEAVTDRPFTNTGQAIKFDGDRDSVLVPNAVQLISDYTTVSFWIRVDSINTAEAEAYIMSFGHWSERWKISLPQHTKIVWTTNSMNSQFDNAISDMDSGDGNELVPGFWWYVTMVHDGADDIIYVDGEEVNRKPATGTLNSTSRPFGIGNNPIEGMQYFNGALDEIKVYNKALTGEEVARLYSSGTTGLNDLLTSELRNYVDVAYPNPAIDRLYVEHNLPANQAVLLRVFDTAGRQVDGMQYDRNELPPGQFFLDVADYTPGTYFLNVVLGGKNLGVVKFYKQ